MDALETIDKTKKLADAKADIEKINFVLQDSNRVKKNNRLFNELSNKLEYRPYFLMHLASSDIPRGNLPFEKVTDFNLRRRIYVLLRESITTYMGTELCEIKKDITNKK